MNNWLEAFYEYLDEIYFKGYAAHLLQNDPEAFTWNYQQFRDLYF